MKTKEEILKHHTGHAHGLMDNTVFSAMEEYAEQAKPKWIPVTEQLPEKYKYVLTWIKNDNMVQINCRVNGRWRVPDFIEVTHWQPLPDAPKV